MQFFLENMKSWNPFFSSEKQSTNKVLLNVKLNKYDCNQTVQVQCRRGASQKKENVEN